MDGKTAKGLGLIGAEIGCAVKLPEDVVKDIIAAPYNHMNDANDTAALLAHLISRRMLPNIVATKPFNVFAEDYEPDAYQQMSNAMSLRVAERGAVLPDMHKAFGLPVGGACALRDAVSPGMVGPDIGCAVRMTLTDVSGEIAREFGHNNFVRGLEKRTHFGREESPDSVYHEILDDPRWDMLEITRRLHSLAKKQLGTSGSGNHFVDIALYTGAQSLHEHLCIVSHSGSRRVGFDIAAHYEKIAVKSRGMTGEFAHLAWLEKGEAAFDEYVFAMTLAADFARANHEVIHARLVDYFGLDNTIQGEYFNWHNFAWQEGGLWVHRKGATPAFNGQWGIIPGTMATKGALVIGLGREDALNSAPHGAGRLMSRRAAKEQFGDGWLEVVNDAGVTVIGASADESPFAYKDIDSVLAIGVREQLFKVAGTFQPIVVRMAGAEGQY